MSIFTKAISTKSLRKELEEREANSSSCSCAVPLNTWKFDAKSATGLSAFFAAMTLISNSIAMMPIEEKQMEQNKKSTIPDSHVSSLFYNMFLTKFMVMKKLVEDIILAGNGYLYIMRDAHSNPIKLVYLRPGQVSIKYDELSQNLSYIVNSTNIPIKKIIQDQDMLHFVMHTNDGVNGISIKTYAKRSIDTANATEASANNFFGSGCAINGILKIKSPILNNKQRDEISSAWRQIHGTDGTSGIAVLSGVEDFTQITNDPDKSQMLESRVFNVTEIARFFNINPILLGDLSHTSYSDIEQANLEFVQHTLLPWIEMFENEITRKLITSKQHFINLDENVLLKSNKSNMANYISTLTNAGVITINEGRGLLDLNPMDGADNLIIPYTNIEQNTINNQPQTEPTE